MAIAARQLQQVCLNLMTNAIQAMSPLGSGTLTVSTRCTRACGSCWKCAIVDREFPTQRRRTSPSSRSLPRRTKVGEGTGLGLSVSYGIVTAHGGTIGVVSTSSAGTTFRVALPAAAEPAHDASPQDVGGMVRRSPLSGATRAVHRRRADAARGRSGVWTDARIHRARRVGWHRRNRDDSSEPRGRHCLRFANAGHGRSGVS